MSPSRCGGAAATRQGSGHTTAAHSARPKGAGAVARGSCCAAPHVLHDACAACTRGARRSKPLQCAHSDGAGQFKSGTCHVETTYLGSCAPRAAWAVASDADRRWRRPQAVAQVRAGGACRCVKWASGGADLLACSEHESNVHIIDARTWASQARPARGFHA